VSDNDHSNIPGSVIDEFLERNVVWTPSDNAVSDKVSSLSRVNTSTLRRAYASEMWDLYNDQQDRKVADSILLSTMQSGDDSGSEASDTDSESIKLTISKRTKDFVQCAITGMVSN
jgi:hypothetical protein